MDMAFESHHHGIGMKRSIPRTSWHRREGFYYTMFTYYHPICEVGYQVLILAMDVTEYPRGVRPACRRKYTDQPLRIQLCNKLHRDWSMSKAMDQS